MTTQAAKSAPATAGPQASASEDRFDIAEIRVLGNSVLAAVEIERAVYPFTGPNKSIADVQAARAALEEAYHTHGFATVFVDIPEQEVGAGVIRLRATEGRLDRVRVSGLRYFSARKILAELPEVKSGTVPSLPTLQRELAALNAETADRPVTPVLKAGRTPGTVDLDLRVNDTLPLHGALTLNDRYTPETSRLRSTVDLSYGNLFQDFQSMSFEYQTAPERLSDEKVASLTYVAPLWFGHNLLALYAIDTKSNVAAVGSLSLLGTGQVYGAHFIHPIVFNELTQNINFGADFKDFSQTVNVIGQPPDKTPIRYINWSLTYSMNAHGEHHDTALNLGVDFGLRGVPNETAQFDYKRFMAQPDYFYLKGSLDHRHALFLGTSLDARIGFQLADGPLVSNEQFGIGGVDTVRGYLESIALGDNGYTGSFELRSPNWSFGPNAENHVTAYLFYDLGMVAIIDPLPLQQSRYDLESAGIGARLIAFHGLDAMLNWADPLKTVTTVKRNHSRVEFQLRYGF